MLSIGIPSGQPALEVMNALNEKAAAVSPSYESPSGHLAMLPLSDRVVWHAHFRVRTDDAGHGSISFMGGWPHLRSSSRQRARLVGLPIADADAPLMYRVVLQSIEPTDLSKPLPVVSEQSSGDMLTAFAPGAAPVVDAMRAVGPDAEFLLIVQLAVLARSVAVADDASALPDQPLPVADQAAIPPKFPMLFPVGMLSGLDRIKQRGPQPDVIVRGTIEQATPCNAGIAAAVLDPALPDTGWEGLGIFMHLRVRTAGDLTIDVACKPEDIVGEPAVGRVVHIQGTANVKLTPEAVNDRASESEPRLWIRREDAWEPLDARPDPALERAPLMDSQHVKPAVEPANSKNLQRPLLVPLLGLLSGIVGTIFVLPSPLALILNLWLMLRRRATRIGRLIAFLGVVCSLVGVAIFAVIAYGIITELMNVSEAG